MVDGDDDDDDDDDDDVDDNDDDGEDDDDDDDDDHGPVPRKMVKFNPGLSEILITIFLLRECNSSLQNAVELLL